MYYLQKEMKDGKHKYLADALKFLNLAAEDLDNEYYLQMAKHHLDLAIPKLEGADKVERVRHGEVVLEEEPRDEAGWRRELLLNYYLNVELAYYKKKDETYTKWTVFQDVVQKNGWEKILKFMNEMDEYISSSKDTEMIKTSLTEKEMQNFRTTYQKEIIPYIKKHLSPVEQFQAKLRLEQRLAILEKKVSSKETTIAFGEWVREKRKALQLSLNDLSERTGYSAAYIYRIEKGTRKNPTPKVVTSIVQALGYEPEAILPMFFANGMDEGADNKDATIELLDWLKFGNYTLDGSPLDSEKKRILSEIVRMFTDKDVLRAPKITELKKKIREFQK